jgi:hypothetical protein
LRVESLITGEISPIITVITNESAVVAQDILRTKPSPRSQNYPYNAKNSGQSVSKS